MAFPPALHKHFQISGTGKTFWGHQHHGGSCGSILEPFLRSASFLNLYNHQEGTKTHTTTPCLSLKGPHGCTPRSPPIWGPSGSRPAASPRSIALPARSSSSAEQAQPWPSTFRRGFHSDRHPKAPDPGCSCKDLGRGRRAEGAHGAADGCVPPSSPMASGAHRGWDVPSCCSHPLLRPMGGFPATPVPSPVIFGCSPAGRGHQWGYWGQEEAVMPQRCLWGSGAALAAAVGFGFLTCSALRC